eukprot:3048308-Rhodomonas_salina.2
MSSARPPASACPSPSHAALLPLPAQRAAAPAEAGLRSFSCPSGHGPPPAAPSPQRRAFRHPLSSTFCLPAAANPAEHAHPCSESGAPWGRLSR